VVATDVGGVAEVVRNGGTGLVVRSRDVGALEDAIYALYEDTATSSSMSLTARSEVEGLYSAEECARTHLAAYRSALQNHGARYAPAAEGAPTGVGELHDLRVLLVCPGCHGPLEWGDLWAECRDCGASYPVLDGVPVLLPAGAARAEPSDEPAGDSTQICGDEVDAEFEIRRPHRTPRMHQWLLGLQMRRALRELEGLVASAPVVTACRSSGMDAEYLARCGGRVLTVEFSLGACQRATARARRFGLPILPVVADVTRLPFADQSGVAELGRIARHAVSITEPVDALPTRAAVAAGAATDVGDSGDVVRRVCPKAIAARLRDAGFSHVETQRYAMYYRHEPGPLVRLASGRLVYGWARRAVQLASWALGPIGNKCAVRARRTAHESADGR
jgi:uncharacterized protein YbaR (Trm112 family)